MSNLMIKEAVDSKNPSHYVNNDEFKLALQDFYELTKKAKAEGKDSPKVPEYIGECFLKIARGLANKHNFRNYSYINDMISNSVIVCLKYIHSFDPYKGTSAFGYFTLCIWRSFLNTIAAEKKQEKTKRSLFFSGNYDTFSLSEDDSELQISYNEFLQSLGKDSTEYISPEKKKKNKFNNKSTSLDVLFGE